MDIATIFKQLNISKLSIAWAYLTGGWAGIAKLICEAFTKLLAKADPQKLKEYSTLASDISSYIKTGVNLFVKDEKIKTAAESTADAINGLAEHLSDGIYKEAELNQDIDNITVCINAWKDVAK